MGILCKLCSVIFKKTGTSVQYHPIKIKLAKKYIVYKKLKDNYILSRILISRFFNDKDYDIPCK